MLENLGQPVTFPLSFAALLHELNAHMGKRWVQKLGRRLRLSNDEIDRTAWLTEHHNALVKAQSAPPSLLKTLFRHPGIEELLTLHVADAQAENQSTDHVDFCREWLSKWDDNDLNPPYLLTGDDFKKNGMKPGPMFKQLLESVRTAQLDGTITTTEEAWDMVKEMLANQEGN